MNAVKPEDINVEELHDALFMGNQGGRHNAPVIDTTDVHQLKNVDQMTAVSLFEIVDELDCIAVQNATVHTLESRPWSNHLESAEHVDDADFMVVTVQAVVDVDLARRMNEDVAEEDIANPDLKPMLNNILDTFIDFDRVSGQEAQRNKKALIAEKEAQLQQLQAELDELKN